MIELHLGDCLEILRTMPDKSVDAVVTDPPYGLRFMGKAWDYNVPSVEIWREVLRVLKPGGHLLSFGGTRTYHRMAVNIEDAGFEIRDQIQWLYGSGFPKSHNIGSLGTALKPANEPICLARKPLDGTVKENVEKWGTGAINIDDCRIGIDETDNIFAKNPHTVGTIGDNGIYGSGVPTSYAVPAGRWPANVILDEEAALMLDEQSGVSATKRNEKPSDCGGNTWGGTFQTHRGARGHTDSGGASRFFYVAKASRKERNAGLEGMPEHEKHTLNKYVHNSVGRTAPKNGSPMQNHHPTVKPITLMRYLCKLITPPGGIVLDPFMGSWSTGCGAKLEGFGFVGIEIDKDYLEIAKRRIENA